MTQPPSFEVKAKENMVYKLHKELYGLKQVPRTWNKKIDTTLAQIDFKRCEVEHGVYVMMKGESILLLICVYEDDLLVT